jgi:hypothetical protein
MNNNNFVKNINTDLFVTEDLKEEKNIYGWVPPENLETRFGVELEACIRTTPDCINFDTNLQNILPKDFTFKDRFDIYYKNIITKSRYFRGLARKYEYLYVYDMEKQGKHYYYDMKNPTLPGMTEMEIVERKDLEFRKDYGDDYNAPYRQLYYLNPSSEIKNIVEKASKYELPMFVDDLSIRCGQTKSPLEREEAGITDINSFRFECITPILSIKGYPTKEKIKSVLYPLLSLFGLDKPQCFIQNFSMGFHVNVSLYNSKLNKYVAIAEPPFLNQLLKNYIPVEKTIYKLVRTRKPLGAPENYSTKFARPLYNNLNKFKIENPSLTETQIIDTLMTNKEYMNEKYKGIKRKTPFLLEFRLFEADNEINRLVNHVSTTLDILHRSANEISKTSKLALTASTNENNDVNDNIVANRNRNGGTRRLKRKNRRNTLRRK